MLLNGIEEFNGSDEQLKMLLNGLEEYIKSIKSLDRLHVWASRAWAAVSLMDDVYYIIANRFGRKEAGVFQERLEQFRMLLQSLMVNLLEVELGSGHERLGKLLSVYSTLKELRDILQKKLVFVLSSDMVFVSTMNDIIEKYLLSRTNWEDWHDFILSCIQRVHSVHDEDELEVAWNEDTGSSSIS